jgi:hypothetical protein
MPYGLLVDVVVVGCGVACALTAGPTSVKLNGLLRSSSTSSRLPSATC